MFNITTTAAVDTSTLHLRGPDDELLYDVQGEGDAQTRTPIQITVYGPGSRQYQTAQSRQQNRAVDKLKKKGKIDQSADEKLAEQAAFLAACTVSFDGFTYGDGSLTGVDLFKAAYADPTIGFVAQQVNAHIGDWANFTKGSATS